MLKCFHFVLSILLLFESSYVHADIGTISGYPQVDIRDLNALTLSWNQVHYLVRENLLEIDELRKMHDEFYRELYDCFGLETCLRHSNLMDGPPQVGGQLGAGALLASLRNERQQLETRHHSLDQGIRQLSNQVNNRGYGGGQGSSSSSNSWSQQTSGSQGGRSWSSSSSSRSSWSSSSSSSGQWGGGSRYDSDQGPEQGRG